MSIAAHAIVLKQYGFSTLGEHRSPEYRMRDEKAELLAWAAR